MKRALAAILAVLIVLLSVFSVTGVGPFAPVQEFLKLGLDFQGGVTVVMEAQTDVTGAELKDLMERTQNIIENRVNQMGLSEPVVTIEGEKRIRVELPGADDADDAIKTIGKTAQLIFFMGDGTTVLDGSMVKDAFLTQSQEGLPAVGLEFDEVGTHNFAVATERAVAGAVYNAKTGLPAVGLEFDEVGTHNFAVATERAVAGAVYNAKTGLVDRKIYIALDNKIISDPGVGAVINDGRAVIEGNFTSDEAIELVQLLRAGALPVNLEEIETSVIGPNLGIDALKSSVIAGAIGIGLVLIIMLVFYYGMGLVADIALLLYIVATFWVFALFAAVLNLPGIAGIILAIGMAVDANVIIFARIREEFGSGKTLRVSVDGGFKRAFSTVLDSQITTLIAGVVLYQFGTGSVKGFALTLMVGIFISVLTAVLVSQFLLKAMVAGKIAPKFFGVGHWLNKITPKFKYIQNRYKLYAFSAIIIVIGLLVGLIRGFNYGIDFTGGTRLHIDMGEVVEVQDIRDIMKENGLDGTVVHSGEGNQEIVIKTTKALDNEARQEILKDFNTKFGTTEDDVLAIEHFSASVGDMLKSNAVKAVLIAAVCMLIYIAIRFEWRYGVGAIAALAHDVLMVVAIYGLFNIPINTPFIAGILTVVGYSINDTIVVFDRIRENNRLMKKSNLEELVDTSINQTLVRSLMTSVTTLVAIVPLIIMGGTTMREFCIPLVVGLLAGALSSVTIASPIYYELVKATKKSKYKGKTAKSSKGTKKSLRDLQAEQEAAEK